MTTDELMKAVYNALTEKQGRDITVIDIHEISQQYASRGKPGRLRTGDHG